MSNGGIFGGNVLGCFSGPTFTNKGAALGAIPEACWNSPKFVEAETNCGDYSQYASTYWKEGRDVADCYSATSEQDCTKMAYDKCLNRALKYCPKVGPSAVPKKGAKCNSKAVIEFVQAQIGTNVDGNWGSKSQAALKKTGKSFKSFVPDCVGSAPGTGGSGYTTTTTTTTTEEPKPTPQKKAFDFDFSKKFLGLPTIAWAGIAGVAGVLLLAAKKKKASQ
jgi:hypothetical protein